MRSAQQALLSEVDYLASEEKSPIRREYVDGQVYAMAGGSLRHNRIAINTVIALQTGLSGKNCQVFMSDVKLRVARDNAYYYPDVMVACGEASPVAGDAQTIEAPTLVVEVLSPSTETIDRREKFAAYRRLPSLMEYALISQDIQFVDLYRRQGDIGWVYFGFEAGDVVELASLGLEIPMRDIYADTDAVYCL